MQALSELFDQTTLAIPAYRSAPPASLNPLTGHSLSVTPLTQPMGQHWRPLLKKSLLPLWLPFNLPRIWWAVRQSDAVHTPMGGNVGTFGILVALAQRKPLFVRYCGRWGYPSTAAERFWHWLLLRIADGRNVVLATGGGSQPPSVENPTIQWIFSTSMRQVEIDALTPAQPWQTGEPLRLITVSWMEPGKNIDRVIRALPLVREHYLRTTLDIVGDGPCWSALRQLAQDLHLSDAVTFHGGVSHDRVIAALRQAHVYCLPSDSEGFPKAVHEALACGLPVIATPVSVLPTLIGDHSGVLLSDIRPETIAEAILDLISDDGRFAEMARRARETSQAYSLEKWRDEIGERLRRAWGPLSSND